MTRPMTRHMAHPKSAPCLRVACIHPGDGPSTCDPGGGPGNGTEPVECNRARLVGGTFARLMNSRLHGPPAHDPTRAHPGLQAVRLFGLIMFYYIPPRGAGRRGGLFYWGVVPDRKPVDTLSAGYNLIPPKKTLLIRLLLISETADPSVRSIRSRLFGSGFSTAAVAAIAAAAAAVIRG